MDFTWWLLNKTAFKCIFLNCFQPIRMECGEDFVINVYCTSHSVVACMNDKDVDSNVGLKALSACKDACRQSLQALEWFLTSCVNLREWIPKHMRWVFILCSQLTSHSFQMSHLTQSGVARIHFGSGRECTDLQSRWISHLLFWVYRQSTFSG